MADSAGATRTPGGKGRRRVILQILGGLALVIVVGLAALMLTFMPRSLALPQVSVGPLPPASPPPGMTISQLPTGSYDSPAALTYRGGAWGDTRHLAATAVLVHHPKGDILIDSGFGANVDEQMTLLPSMQRSTHHKGATVAQQLAAHGLKSSDIAAIIPTHAHWDHISGVDDLKGVPVLESAAGQAFIRSKAKGTEVINSLRSVNYKSYKFDGGPYLGFPRSHDVWGDGSVVIVPAPGHTPDSVAVFVALPSGKRYALIGDMVFQDEGLQIPAEKPWMLRSLIGENNKVIHEDIALIRAATARYPQLRAIPAHDQRAFNMLPAFPASAN